MILRIFTAGDIAIDSLYLGNEKIFPVSLNDITPLNYTHLSIMNIDQVTEGYAKVGDRIWVVVIFSERLSQDPIIMINNVEAEIVQVQDGADFGVSWYKYVGEVVMTKSMNDGEIEFTVRGEKVNTDGLELANSDITTDLKSIVLDKIHPSVTIKTGSNETIKDGDAYELISFKLFDSKGLLSYTLNSRTAALSNSAWSDINYVKVGSFGGVEGNNVLLVSDRAGNVTRVEFVLKASVSEVTDYEY